MIEQPNWQAVVNDLLKNRTQLKLSEQTGIPQSTISDLKRGVKKKRLPFESGAKLLNLLNKTPQA